MKSKVLACGISDVICFHTKRFFAAACPKAGALQLAKMAAA